MRAQLTTSALTVGTHSLFAIYRGDGLFAGNSSGPISQTVYSGTKPAQTETTLFSSPNPSTECARLCSASGAAGRLASLHRAIVACVDAYMSICKLPTRHDAQAPRLLRLPRAHDPQHPPRVAMPNSPASRRARMWPHAAIPEKGSDQPFANPRTGISTSADLLIE